jgi:SGT1 protein
VYIYDGSIHLIANNDNNPDEIKVDSCLNLVRSQNEQTKAADGIQNAILSRVKGCVVYFDGCSDLLMYQFHRYPERAKQSLHYTNVYVPASVAALLEVKPQLIAPATVAFCDRDMIDSKV